MSDLSDWTPVYSGKVRTIYIPKTASNLDSADKMLLVATDRISAFDHILSPEIPGKGAVLTALSHWWCDTLADVPNHRLDESPPVEVSARAMVVMPLHMFPVECVVRGYLAGSGWKEYQQTGTVCGIELPEGLSEGDPLPEPLFTPATKAAVGDHDENIDYDTLCDIVGSHDAGELRRLSLDLYARARDIAAAKGLILADTKFEFGRNRSTGEITLGDEVLTSDSSRYWDAQVYSAGGINRLDSFDKQLVRNWLSDNWDGEGEPPELPHDLVEHALSRYQELSRRMMAVTTSKD